MGRHWRWAVAAAATALVCAVPTLVGRLPARAERMAPGALLARVRASAPVGYSGLAESRGTLGLPSLPRLGAASDLLSGTSRMRVWYAGPRQLRVDRLTLIGEEDGYLDRDGSWLWSSGEGRATRIDGVPPLRLPESADLLPPELGRRLLRPARPAELQRLPERRVAGRAAAGLRVRPSGVTTISRIDVWADPSSGLPLRVDVFAKGSGAAVVTARFLDVRLSRPKAELTEFALPEDARVSERQTPDLVSTIDRYAPYRLPPRLAGLPQQPRVDGLDGGAATYGEGYTLLAAMPLRTDFAFEVRDRLLAGAPPLRVGGASGAAVSTPGVTVLVVTADPSLLLAGTVPLAVLKQAAAELLRTPLPLR